MTCRYWYALLLLTFAACSHISAAAEPTCPNPRVVAPGKFNNNPRQWGTSDTGIIASGFVDLSQGDGKVFELEHGVDLSVYNAIAYDKAKQCGASFAFVKLDDMYDLHLQKLREVGIRTLPYAFFPIPPELRTSAPFGEAPEGSQKLDQLLNKFEALGKGAAENLLSQLKRRGGLQPVSFANSQVKVIAVDIEQKLGDEPHSTKEQRVAYGRAYARSLCSWLETMHSEQPSLVAVLYTTPAVYGDYLRYALSRDNACINGLPIWLAHTTSDAGDSIYSSTRGASSPNIDQAAQRLCLVNGGNRCVIHQYSHRAIFAAVGSPRQNVPPHTDIDRWFVTRVISAEAGPQYVRRDSLRKPEPHS